MQPQVRQRLEPPEAKKDKEGSPLSPEPSEKCVSPPTPWFWTLASRNVRRSMSIALSKKKKEGWGVVFIFVDPNLLTHSSNTVGWLPACASQDWGRRVSESGSRPHQLLPLDRGEMETTTGQWHEFFDNTVTRAAGLNSECNRSSVTHPF